MKQQVIGETKKGEQKTQENKAQEQKKEKQPVVTKSEVQETKQEVEQTKENKVEQCINNKHQMPVGNSKKWFDTKEDAVKYYKSLQKLWSDKLVNNEVDDDEYDANCPYGYQNWNCPKCGMITLDFYFRIEEN